MLQQRLVQDSVVCKCGGLLFHGLEKDHEFSRYHIRYMRVVEGVECECGFVMHPTLEEYTHKFHPRHVTYMGEKVACACGSVVQRQNMPRHLSSKLHKKQANKLY